MAKRMLSYTWQECSCGRTYSPDVRLRTVGCIGFFGEPTEIVTDHELGRGRWYRGNPDSLITRLIYDAAWGYVSGFNKRDIAYYIVTRSLGIKWLSKFAFKYEAPKRRESWPNWCPID